MTTLREAAQQALEALENDVMQLTYAGGVRISNAAIALRAAMAQQAEPVDFVSLLREADEIVRGKPTWKRFIDGTPLSNDIAVWMTVFAQDVARRAAPPQRKPLTDEEIQDCFHAARNAKLGATSDNSKHRLSVVEIARAIERAHGIGGTP